MRTSSNLAVALMLAFATCSTASAKMTIAGVWSAVDQMEKAKDYGFVEIDDKLNISTADVKKRYGEVSQVEHYHLQHPPRTVTVWRYKRPNGTLEFRFFLDTKHVNQIELKKAK